MIQQGNVSTDPLGTIREWRMAVKLLFQKQILACLLVIAFVAPSGCRVSDAPPRSRSVSSKPQEAKVQVVQVSNQAEIENPLSPKRASQFLEQICQLGPRITGSEAMKKQQELLTKHFEELGGKVRLQPFKFRHPQNRGWFSGSNLIVHWNPKATDRILLCAHYDTRPQGDNSNVHRRDRGNYFIGANDGASGVALMMELAYQMRDLNSRFGVDFLLVDAEEFVFSRKDKYFVGSEMFSRDYVKNPPNYRYRKAALLDMIGDRNLQIYQDRNSVLWKDTRPVTREIWATANRLGVKEFIAHTHPKRKDPIRDDHLMLHNVGKIPTCQIIDFDYPRWPLNRYWHTSEDTPERCSGESIAKVGWVMLEWLRTAK
ncbi:MAG: M28 family peptidase [Planctomycetales bacterium]